MREANNGIKSKNNENSSAKTMFLIMQKRGEREGGGKWVDSISQFSF